MLTLSNVGRPTIPALVLWPLLDNCLAPLPPGRGVGIITGSSIGLARGGNCILTQ